MELWVGKPEGVNIFLIFFIKIIVAHVFLYLNSQGRLRE